MSRKLDYGRLMHKALRGLMSEVLADVAENGLPGDHHFFITFDTTHPGVDIPGYLRARYPDQMTIVLQEWFEDLSVTGDRFAVTLNFNEQPEPLVIPFDAIRTFVDPSVEFGLRFDQQDEDDDEDADTEDGIDMPDPDEPEEDAPRKGGDVVSLDRFRKQ